MTDDPAVSIPGIDVDLRGFVDIQNLADVASEGRKVIAARLNAHGFVPGLGYFRTPSTLLAFFSVRHTDDIFVEQTGRARRSLLLFNSLGVFKRVILIFHVFSYYAS